MVRLKLALIWIAAPILGALALWIAVRHVEQDRPSGLPSTDVAELSKLSEVQWEVFATPEYSRDDLVPAPTDYLSLIVVGRPTANTSPTKELELTAPPFVPSNAGRQWLPARMKNAIERMAAGKLPSSGLRCRRLEYTTTKPRSFKEGFACREGGAEMYFLILESPDD